MTLIITLPVGYNIRVDRLRQQIFRGITALRKDGRRFPWLYAQYALYSSSLNMSDQTTEAMSTLPHGMAWPELSGNPSVPRLWTKWLS